MDDYLEGHWPPAAEPTPALDIAPGGSLTLLMPVPVVVRSPGAVPPWRVRLAQRHGDPRLLGTDWPAAGVLAEVPPPSPTMLRPVICPRVPIVEPRPPATYGLAQAIVEAAVALRDAVRLWRAGDEEREDEEPLVEAWEPELMCPPVTASLLYALTAEVLGEPVQAVEPVQSVGRLHLVRYQPFQRPDPDLIVAVDPRARRFHRAVAAFQKARLTGQPGHLETWYRGARRKADRVLDALADLDPHSLEADFVAAWAYDACASGSWA